MPPAVIAKTPRKLKPLSWLDKLLALWILLAVRRRSTFEKICSRAHRWPLASSSVNSSPPPRAYSMRPSLSMSPCRSVRPSALVVRGRAQKAAAIGLLIMMWPILCRISFTAIRDIFRDRKIWYHLAFVRSLLDLQIRAEALAVHRGKLDRRAFADAGASVGFPSRSRGSATRADPRWSCSLHCHGLHLDRHSRWRHSLCVAPLLDKP